MSILNEVDARISQVVRNKAGEKLSKVLDTADELVLRGKSPERALADALEKHRLL
jgi:hypothetical protein